MADVNFRFWPSYRETLRRLGAEDGYALVMALCDYVFDGTEPEFEPGTPLYFAWPTIAAQAGESAAMSKRMAEIGAKGGSAKKSSDAQATLKQRSSLRKGKVLKGNTLPSGKVSASRAGAVDSAARSRDGMPDDLYRGDSL